MVGLVHLLTLGWISGSIPGAFYIVAPVALRMPMPVSAADWAAFGAFALGTIGMVAHFWIDRYDGVAWAALLVSAAMLHLALRTERGLRAAPVPWAVKLHVALAFFNVIAAARCGRPHAALLWLVVALGLGLAASTDLPGERRIGLIWMYGVAGLVRFLGQIVAGMQGRLVPMYAWYRAFAELRGEPPARPANALPSPTFARAIFILWALGVPVLAVGLAAEYRIATTATAALLGGGVCLGGVYISFLLRTAGTKVELAPASVRALV